MKKLIAATLLSLIAPAAFAGSCIINTYDRNFIFYGDSSLPTLKIMSVTPNAANKYLSTTKIITPQVLNLAGYKFDVCSAGEGLSAMSATTSHAESTASVSKGDSVMTVRVGYDNSHYTDIMIYIKSTFFSGFKTNVMSVDPQPHGMSYQPQAISQSSTGNVSLHFTKQGN